MNATDGSDGRVLASMAVGAGVEAVICPGQAGRAWLSEEQDGRRTPRRTQFTFGEGPAGPWQPEVPRGTLLTGELPPGATRVTVVASAEPSELLAVNGVYMVLLPASVSFGEVFLVFRDDADRIVPRRLEDEVLKRAPARDSDPDRMCIGPAWDDERRCPACREVAWDVVEVRTDPDEAYHRHRELVCRVCGLGWGSWEPLWPRRERSDGGCAARDVSWGGCAHRFI